jgi:stringent starvation protein B
MAEIPTKPYLLRALHQWCVDNGYTPHIAVRVDSKTQVPAEYVKGGEITLNVSPNAVHKLHMGNDVVEFSARFGGVARQISLPMDNIYALYAKETRQGMSFDIDGPKPIVPAKGEMEAVPTTARPPTALPAPATDPRKPSGGGKPTLRRIK